MDGVKQEGTEEAFPSDVLMSYWADPKVEAKLEDKSQLWPITKSEVNEVAREKKHSVEKEQLASGLAQAKKKQKGLNIANSDVTTRNSQTKNNCLGQKPSNGNSKTRLSLKSLRDLENAKLSSTVQNLCKYQCPKCDKIYRSSDSLSLHFTKTKHVLLLRNISNTSDYLIEIVAFQCNLCNRKILCNTQSIVHHFRKNHKIFSIKEYCSKSNIEHNSKYGKFKEDFNLFYTNHPKKHNFSKNIENLCKYECIHCGYVCWWWRKMSQHITTTGHGPTQTPTQCVTKVTFYKCQLCNEIMLCDINIIKDHLRKHKVTVTEYKRKHQNHQYENSNYLETQCMHKLQWFIKDIPAFKGKSIRFLKPQNLPSYQDLKNPCKDDFFKYPV